MPRVLAIEPNTAQQPTLQRMLRGLPGTLVLVVHSKDAALDSIQQQVPDLLLLGTLMSPRDETDLLGYLKTLPDAGHLQTLRIPLLRKPTPERRSRLSFLGGRSSKTAAEGTGCDPKVFVEEVGEYLAKAAELKAEAKETAALEAPDSAAPVEAPRPGVPPPIDISELLDIPVENCTPAIQEDSGVTAVGAETPVPAAATQVPQDAADERLHDELSQVRAEAEEKLATEVARVRAEADERHQADVEQIRAEADAVREAAVEEARTAAEAEADDRLRVDLERARTELAELRNAAAAQSQAAAEALEAEVARVRTEADDRLTAEVDRARREAEEQRKVQLEEAEREADASRAEAAREARAAAEAAAAEALENELASVRAENETRLAQELERAQAETRQEAAHEARADAEAAATKALEAELIRVRTENEKRLEEELAHVRAEAQETHEAQLAEAEREAEARRAEAAREARAVAEAAAATALEVELARVHTENETRLARELEHARIEASEAHEAKLAEAERAAEALRDEAAREARAAAEAAAAESLEIELGRVQAENETRLATELERARGDAGTANRASEDDQDAKSSHIAAANDLIEVEVSRIREDAEKRLAEELAKVRQAEEERRQAEFRAIEAQVAELKDAAVAQARATEEALAAELTKIRQDHPQAAVASDKRAPTGMWATSQSRASTAPTPIADSVPTGLAQAKTSGNAALMTMADNVAAPDSTNDYYSLWRKQTRKRVRPELAETAAPRRRGRCVMALAAGLLLVLADGLVRNTTSRVGAQAESDMAEAGIGAGLPVLSIPALPMGELQVESTPAGARVLVDGEERGQTPLMLPDVPAGRHRITLESDAGTVRRTIFVREGQTAAVVEAILPGWLAVFSRVKLDIYIGGRRLGSSEDGHLMLSPGQYDIELVSERLGLRVTREIEIEPGAVTAHNMELPNGRLQVDGPSGAEVWIENALVGQVPVADVAVPIGIRRVVVRHPDGREWQRSIDVKLGSPTVVTFDAPETSRARR